MNFRILSLLSALVLAPCAPAVTLVATFEGLNSASSPGSSYSEGGLQFSSPTSFGVTSGYHSATLFGGGGHPHGSTALYVNNTGWVGISAPGSLMNSIAFTYGFDWNFYAIENGLMDVTLQWETLLNGVVTGTGSMTNGRDNRSHGGANVEIFGTGDGFDQIRLRSTAVEYQGVYTGGTGPGGWTYDRGNAIGWGDQNRLAFDNVRVQTAFNQRSAQAAVPDHSNTLILFLLAGAGLWAVRRHRRPTTLPPEASEPRG
jgi:hypothetical protein